MSISDKDKKVLLKAQQGELDAVLMYQALADTVKDEADAAAFRQLAAEEGRHASVFKNMTDETLRPKKTLATFVPLLYKIIGKKRLYPIIAKAEYDAAKTYAPVAEKFPEAESVKNDEHRHGDIVTGLLQQNK